MIYAKLDVDIADHPRAFAAGVEAFGLWAWGLAYTRKHDLDGRIPKVAAFIALGGKQNEKLAQKLLDAGLWIADGDSFIVFNYAEKNETKAQVQKRKEQTKERVTRYRSVTRDDVTQAVTQPCNASVPGSGSGSGSVYLDPEGGLGETEPAADDPGAPANDSEPSELTKAQKLEAWESKVRDAYCRGISAGKGGAFAWPGGNQDQGLLNQCVKAFGRAKNKDDPFRGEAVTEWTFNFAGAFALDVVEKGTSKYYSAFSPKGFMRWLNEYHQQNEARRVGS